MMKKFLLFGSILFFIWGCNSTTESYIKYVNPFIGTEGVGHTYPGATVPFGMVQLSPDTRSNDWSACSGYQFVDDSLYGFSHTHLSGTGCCDLGDVLFLPISGAVDEEFVKNPTKVLMDKASEAAQAGYYTVTLADGTKAEMTATERCGVHRYTYPKDGERSLLINLSHMLLNEQIHELEIKQISDREIVGKRYTSGWTPKQPVYFVARFSEPITGLTLYNGDQKTDAKELLNSDVKALVGFEKSDKPVEIYVGISATGYDGATKNIDKEVGNKNFDELLKKAQDKWNEELAKIVIEGATEDEKVIFYTSLYHSLICPIVFSDVDNKYLGMDGEVHQGDAPQYTIFSLWDTFRALHPLFSLLDTERVGDMMQSIVNQGDQFGYFPKWELWGGETDCMIGKHAISVLSEAIVKDIKGFDYEQAYVACKRTLELGTDQYSLYDKYGYIPENESGQGSVSKSLEYAYNDWCMAQIAKKLGKTEDYEHYISKALNYQKLFDGETGFFRGKAINGEFDKGFSLASTDPNFTEATPWQYRHFAPHDAIGLSNLLGGRDSLASSLNALFNAESTEFGAALPDISGLIGQYAHGNEPSHGTAYLYAYSSEPWKTSAITKEVLNTLYKNAPDGLCGNEDCGQMSAWYILTSMGIYPMCPASDQFIITAPLFSKSTIKLANGKMFTTEVKGDRTLPYINKVWLNDKELDRNWITYNDIMSGGTLIFELSDVPNTTRATSDEAVPYSTTTAQKASTPYSPSRIKFFDPQCEVVLAARNAGAKIYYTTDGSQPTDKSTLYIAPLKVTETSEIKAVAYVDGLEKSETMSITAEKADYLKGVDVVPVKNGINFSYYEGNFKRVSDITTVEPKITGVCKDFSTKFEGRAEDHFGFIFSAYFKVNRRDVFRFEIYSDDGSVLYIDDQPVVLNDESHETFKCYGYVALDKGFHKLELKYFDDTFGDNLSISYKGDGHDGPGIPISKLFVK